VKGREQSPWEYLAEHAGIRLGKGTIFKLDIYLQELIKWNRRFNITGSMNPLEIQVKHFQDSFFLIPFLPDEITSLVDIGSGGGFPGLPIKICRPSTAVTLIEPNTHKSNFLRHIKRLLELDQLTIYQGRIEHWLNQHGWIKPSLATPVHENIACSFSDFQGCIFTVNSEMKKRNKEQGLFFVSRAWKRPRDIIEELATQLQSPQSGLILMLGKEGESKIDVLSSVWRRFKLRLTGIHEVTLSYNMGHRVNLLLQPDI